MPEALSSVLPAPSRQAPSVRPPERIASAAPSRDALTLTSADPPRRPVDDSRASTFEVTLEWLGDLAYSGTLGALLTLGPTAGTYMLLTGALGLGPWAAIAAVALTAPLWSGLALQGLMLLTGFIATLTSPYFLEP